MKRTTKTVLIILGFSLLIFLIWYLRSVVSYILIAGVLSLIGQPLVSLISRVKIKKFNLPRAFGAALTLLLFWTLLFSFVSIFIPTVAREADDLANINVVNVIDNLQAPLQKVEAFIQKIQVGSEQKFSIRDYATEKVLSLLKSTYMSQTVRFFAGTLGNIFVAFFSISFMTFFFLKEKNLFRNAILILAPNKYSDEVTHIINSLSNLLKRYFIGICIDVLSVATMVTIGLSVIGLSFSKAIIIATFAGCVNVIPYLGPVIGISFGLLIGIATNLHLDFYTELLPLLGLILLVFLIVQIIDAIVLQPTIYSSSVKAHPLEIFLVIFTAGNLAGIIGMILAIPAYTVLRVVAKEFFVNSKIVKKLTEHI